MTMYILIANNHTAICGYLKNQYLATNDRTLTEQHST